MSQILLLYWAVNVHESFPPAIGGNDARGIRILTLPFNTLMFSMSEMEYEPFGIMPLSGREASCATAKLYIANSIATLKTNLACCCQHIVGVEVMTLLL